MKKIIFVTLLTLLMFSCENKTPLEKCEGCEVSSLSSNPCSTGALGNPNSIHTRSCSVTVSNNYIGGGDITIAGVLTASDVIAPWNGIPNFASGLTSAGAMKYPDTLTKIATIKRLLDSLVIVNNKIATKITMAQATAMFQPIGSYITSESDPAYKADSNKYVRKTLLATTLLNYYNQSYINSTFRTLASSYSKTQVDSIKSTVVSLINGKLNASDTTGKWKSASYVPSWASITGKPTFSTVATTGAYADLSGKPTIYSFSGSATQLTTGTGSYLSAGTALQQLRINSTGAALEWFTFAPSGVTSIGISSADLDVSGSPVTSSGTIALTLKNVGTAGTYGAVTTNSKGLVTSGKRLEAFSGTTSGSGTYTVTYGTAYPTVPNVQPVIRNQTNVNQFALLTSSTTTGFTVTVYQRNTVTLLGVEVLLSSVATANGLTVDVITTER